MVNSRGHSHSKAPSVPRFLPRKPTLYTITLYIILLFSISIIIFVSYTRNVLEDDHGHRFSKDPQFVQVWLFYSLCIAIMKGSISFFWSSGFRFHVIFFEGRLWVLGLGKNVVILFIFLSIFIAGLLNGLNNLSVFVDLGFWRTESLFLNSFCEAGCEWLRFVKVCRSNSRRWGFYLFLSINLWCNLEVNDTVPGFSLQCDWCYFSPLIIVFCGIERNILRFCLIVFFRILFFP